jgi:predicted HTH domain antitoxin
VLAQLRNLELNLKNAMDSIAQHINEERDVLYLRGLDKANEQQQAKFVTNLLREGDFSLERIAKIADVSVEYVTNIQRKLSSNK